MSPSTLVQAAGVQVPGLGGLVLVGQVLAPVLDVPLLAAIWVEGLAAKVQPWSTTAAVLG
jgi:hypothetical protein